MANFKGCKDVQTYMEQRVGKLVNTAWDLLGEGCRFSREIREGVRVSAALVGRK